MSRFAQHERQEICDLFDSLGPDQSTLCDGWRTADMAAHLYLRERRPDAAVGLVFGPLAGHTESVQRAVREAKPWTELVAAVRRGPPWALRPFDEPMNTAEYFTHVEDVRRAREPWEPRPLPDELADALWSRLGLMSRGLARKAPDGVAFEAPGHGRITRGTDPGVTVVGDPGELLLFLFGRGAAARVEFRGDPDAVARLQSVKLGI
jgi:uncharacterized protein (TIGR03085 family)